MSADHSTAAGEIREVAVVGLGTMGAGIAEVLARSGHRVVAVEANHNCLARGLSMVTSRDRPGFLTAAMAYPQLNDAARMVQDAYATPTGIDTAMMLGCGYPRGPLQILDDIGPARVLGVLTAMHASSGDPAFAPAPLLAEHAAAGTPFRS
jgi:3-hydroxybutyryl-CoA dehydrogenase